MRKTLFASAIVAVTGSALIVGAASSETLFFDDFDRQNGFNVGNEWAELELGQKDVAIKGNKLRMRGARKKDPGAAVSRGIKSSKDIFKVSFDWGTSKKVKSRDHLYVSYAFSETPLDNRDSMDDLTLWDKATMQLSNKGKGQFNDGFTIERNGPGKLYIMVWTAANKKKKKLWVDNLVVESLFEMPESPTTSNRVSIAEFSRISQDDGLNDIPPVPVPASLPLMAAALGGMAYMRRRKSKN